MAQKTNLNSAPYYDDFDKDKNFVRTLFQLNLRFRQENSPNFKVSCSFRLSHMVVTYLKRARWLCPVQIMLKLIIH